MAESGKSRVVLEQDQISSLVDISGPCEGSTNSAVSKPRLRKWWGAGVRIQDKRLQQSLNLLRIARVRYRMYPR